MISDFAETHDLQTSIIQSLEKLLKKTKEEIFGFGKNRNKKMKEIELTE